MNFLFFGRITKYKGLNILWEAYKRLLDKYKQQITLSIVGEGDLKLNVNEIKKTIGTNVVNEWIPNEDLYKYFGRKNVVLVCPYIDATQSGVIMLGYDFLVPVIATKTGGIPEQVQDNVTGLLIEPNSIDELYKAMEKFILNIDILSKYSFNIKSYMSNFSWIKSIGKFEKYIDLEGTKGGECL
ncbi:glycosyltransferase [Mycoplasmatota bacterium]|nr:glycosyltransferase [Mycoplasmatota bacterium]